MFVFSNSLAKKVFGFLGILFCFQTMSGDLLMAKPGATWEASRSECVKKMRASIDQIKAKVADEDLKNKCGLLDTMVRCLCGYDQVVQVDYDKDRKLVSTEEQYPFVTLFQKLHKGELKHNVVVEGMNAYGVVRAQFDNINLSKEADTLPCSENHFEQMLHIFAPIIERGAGLTSVDRAMSDRHVAAQVTNALKEFTFTGSLRKTVGPRHAADGGDHVRAEDDKDVAQGEEDNSRTQKIKKAVKWGLGIAGVVAAIFIGRKVYKMYRGYKDIEPLLEKLKNRSPEEMIKVVMQEYPNLSPDAQGHILDLIGDKFAPKAGDQQPDLGKLLPVVMDSLQNIDDEGKRQRMMGDFLNRLNVKVDEDALKQIAGLNGEQVAKLLELGKGAGFFGRIFARVAGIPRAAVRKAVPGNGKGEIKAEKPVGGEAKKDGDRAPVVGGVAFQIPEEFKDKAAAVKFAEEQYAWLEEHVAGMKKGVHAPAPGKSLGQTSAADIKKKWIDWASNKKSLAAYIKEVTK